MNRIQRLKQELETVKEDKKQPKKKKQFKLPFKTRGMLKTASKKDDYIVVQYLTQKYDIKFKLCKIISGNLIVVNNKVHKLNPKMMWKHGKYQWYIHREIDRRPVSNEDLNKVIKAGESTENDVVLIKAVLGAIQRNKQLEGKNIAAIIGILVVVGIVLFVLFGGGG